jgi:hypothetical protein
MIELVRPASLLYRISSWSADEYYLFFSPPPRGEYIKTDRTNWKLATEKGTLYLFGRLEGDEFYSSNNSRQVYIFKSDNPSLLFSTSEGSPFGWIRKYGEHYYYFVILPWMLDRLKLFIKDNDDIVLFEEWKGILEVSHRNDPGYGWWKLKEPRKSSSDEGGEIWLMTGGGGFIVAEKGDGVKWL